MPKKDKKLKTNQMMEIQIGNFGTIKIGHKTEMGKVSQIMEMGNRNREAKGLNQISLDSVLKRQDFWEFVIARNTQYMNISNSAESAELDFMNFQSNYSELTNYKDIAGQIKYSEIIKQFPHLIKSTKGRYGGTWAELYILLKIASILDKELEVEIYRVFIENRILYFRDSGGNEFKELNKLVKILPNSQGQKDYINLSLAMREKLSILDTRGYNDKEHNSLIQEKRTEYQKDLQKFIHVGFIKNIDDLIDALNRLD